MTPEGMSPVPDSRSAAAGLCQLAVRSLPIDGVALVLAGMPEHRMLLASSNPDADRLEELTAIYGEGPAVDAVVDGVPVLAENLTSDASRARWPFLTPQAVALGVRAIFALPLRIGVINLGVLVAHRATSGGLSTADLSRAMQISDAAAFAVLDLMAPMRPPTDPTSEPTTTDTVQNEDGDGGEEAGRLTIAVSSIAAEVHQASGMLMVQLGMPIEAGLARLRAYAFAHELPLIDVAREVIARRLRFER